MSSIPLTPEAEARQTIDRKLSAAGWLLQDYGSHNLQAGYGVALREAPMANGYADYLLFVDGEALGVVEAKKAGETLSSVERQTRKYGEGPKPFIPTWRDDVGPELREALLKLKLIDEDGVQLLLVSSTPETVNPVSDTAEASGVPCISTVAPWQPWLIGRGGAPGAEARSDLRLRRCQCRHGRQRRC